MKYPYGIKRTNEVKITHSNRGMILEDDINNSNMYYLAVNKAVIYKKPTPISINKVDYISRNNATITKAKFIVPSTTDYNGIYKGKYIDFEAKETNSKTSFSLNNIHAHQINHLVSIKNHGGIGFVIVRFNSLNKTYLILIDDITNFIKNEDRKSIPITYFEKYGYLIKDSFNPRLDYLKIIDSIYFKENL